MYNNKFKMAFQKKKFLKHHMIHIIILPKCMQVEKWRPFIQHDRFQSVWYIWLITNKSRGHTVGEPELNCSKTEINLSANGIGMV